MSIKAFLFVSEFFGRTVLEGLSDVRGAQVLGVTGPLPQKQSFRERLARVIGSERVLTIPPPSFLSVALGCVGRRVLRL